jgi:glycosyltransferase involved in cell wall biosynthesis
MHALTIRPRSLRDHAHVRQDPQFSIVFATHRAEPRFDWFADRLSAQLDGARAEVVFVDGRHDATRARRLERIVAGRFPFQHVPPKPTPVNGRFRITQRDYHAASSARNTGIVCSSAPYVVFVDDVSVLMPGWLEAVQRAARAEMVLAGAYEKRWEMVVERGELRSSRTHAAGRDVRWAQGDDRVPVPIPGGQLFGASCGVPRELLLEVGGFDELCDLVGGEDYDLGLRLEFASVPIHYGRQMLTVESEELHRQSEPALRLDKIVDEEFYRQRLFDFGVERRTTDGRCDNSHLILDIRYGTRRSRSLGNYYDLAELAGTDLLDLVERLPRYHWFDQQPYVEL